jgi:hypothetical protein
LQSKDGSGHFAQGGQGWHFFLILFLQGIPVGHIGHTGGII